MNKRIKTPEITFSEIMIRLKQAGLPLRKNVPGPDPDNPESLEELGERVRKMMGLFKKVNRKDNKMIYFIMYDIEHNKIRAHIAKYLLRKGCTRVQKSIFFANSQRSLFNEIQQTLKSVQDMYENNDSIFFVPVSTDEIRAMKVIGKSVDFDLVTGSKNTLFF